MLWYPDLIFIDRYRYFSLFDFSVKQSSYEHFDDHNAWRSDLFHDVRGDLLVKIIMMSTITP